MSCKLVETNDQDPLDAFLQALKDRGLDVQVVMTDGSPLYKDSRQRYWADVEHQLCIFHVIKEGNKLILDGGEPSKTASNDKATKGARSAAVGPPRKPRSTDRTAMA